MEEILNWLNNLFLFKIPHRNRAGEIFTWTLVSEDDFEKLSGSRWQFDHGYARSSVLGYMHRFILGLEKGDKRIVDHINEDTSDNRRENLRITDKSGNSQNRGKMKIKMGEATSSRHRGVYKAGKKWAVEFTLNKKKTRHGRFDDEDDAGRAWDKAAIRSQTGFWQLNFEYTEKEIQAILNEK